MGAAAAQRHRRRGHHARAARSYNDFTYRSQIETPFEPTADTEPALYLGLDRPFDLRPVAIYVQVEPPRPEEVAADELAERDPDERAVIAWEYDAPAGWRSLDAQDETQGFSASGLVSFAAPKDLAERRASAAAAAGCGRDG